MSNDQQIEAAIQAAGRTASRVTPADIEANIAGEFTFTVGNAARALNCPVSEATDLLSICVLTLKNGFTVTGESDFTIRADFDADLSRKVARENAIFKLRMMVMGHELKKFAGKLQAFVFGEFVQIGRTQGVPLINGMPWSFTFNGEPVTHENDKTYLIGSGANQLRFTTDECLFMKTSGEMYLLPATKESRLAPPPVDNAHVAPGCEQFSDATVAAAAGGKPA